MRGFNFDDIDELALQVVRADMARVHKEPLVRPEPTVSQQVEIDFDELPMFLRRQAE